MPATPRGPRRRGNPEAVALLLPKLDPSWELAALTALMKPPRRSVVVSHGTASQRVDEGMATRLEELARVVAGRLGVGVAVEWPEGGDFLAVVRVDPATDEVYRAMAAVLSSATPGLAWKLTVTGGLGSLVVRDGRFFRRTRRTQLALSPARDVHLPREVRAAVSDLIHRLSPSMRRGG